MTILLKELLIAAGVTALDALKAAGEDLERPVDLADLEQTIQANRDSRRGQLDQM
jgi:hypothetical protein